MQTSRITPDTQDYKRIKINGMTYDDFKVAVERMLLLSPAYPRRAPSDCLYGWAIGASPGSVAITILGK